MSRLTELIRQAKEKDPALGAELEREYRTLSGRRAFGLNFERHRPEAVELPGRPVRRGDKVRILSPRRSTDPGDGRLWRVTRTEKVDGERRAHLECVGNDSVEPNTVPVDDLVVIAEFRDPIHPGLVPTGCVNRGGDKPSHTVINGENFHALKALTYTHRGKVSACYIDPPYNTGARDWKYNNDYVEGDDLYRHSKWLAFMERRLLLAKELLDPEDSVLIVTIDEKEVHRLALLLEQLFPETRSQMVTIVINAPGQARRHELARVEEHAFVLFQGAAEPAGWVDDLLNDRPSGSPESVRWESLLRSGTNSRRVDRPALFYPVFIDPGDQRIVSVGDSKALDAGREAWTVPTGTVAVWPLKSDGTEGNWRASPDYLRQLLGDGHARLGTYREAEGRATIWYLGKAALRRIETGEIKVVGSDEQGAVQVAPGAAAARRTTVKTVWNRPSHHAGWHGQALVRALLPGRGFPFPKSLYAVEDAVRLAVADKPDAVVLDFFAGSGTTAHAVMRLNKQDGGRRQCISVTNNEVSADEQRRLREAGLRPGDPQWEALGICDHITKPRIEAAITGRTPDGEPISGDYKFTDEFPMADGFEENAEFFTLTYENPVAIGHNRAFERVAPLLWLRAGAEGRRVDTVPPSGWDVADAYGILFDLDHADAFVGAVEKAERVQLAFAVTDDDRRFQSVARQLPEGVEVVRLYESYLSNFRFTGSEP
ncbi:MAG TPA: site-specific DNA-methyltransferase [Acidimicrobiaceae bacterium]|nr:site-specific DNA-methyltransferase [Acidimicrobiaceae bacterium]